MYCDRCGSPVSREQRSCPKCGTPVRIEDLNGGFWKIVSRQEAAAGASPEQAAEKPSEPKRADRDPAREAAAAELQAAKQEMKKKDAALRQAEQIRKILLIACGVLLFLLLIQTIRAGIYKGRAAKAVSEPVYYDTERSVETQPAETGQPDVQQPDTLQPDAPQPDTSQPDTVQPEDPQPAIQAPPQGLAEPHDPANWKDPGELEDSDGGNTGGTGAIQSPGSIAQDTVEETETRIRAQNQIQGDLESFMKTVSRPQASGDH